MEKPKLLIVDDDESILLSMKWAFGDDYQIFLAADRQEALEIFRREKPPLVSLDLGLPPKPRGVDEGLLTLSALMEEDPFVKVIIISGQDEKENALLAIGQGAYDFFCKPVEVDEVSIMLKRAFRVYELEREHRRLQSLEPGDAFEDLIGASPQMQKVFAAIERIASTEAPVLIMGESGTGKELVAKALHRKSQRMAGSFVAINCAAIPETLLESELFGFEKGAFTGAHTQRKGRVELADKGTLFLDEIGDLALGLQVKLLRFLQEHSIERIGGRKEILIDTRVIAATNRDLDQAITDGRFREDLLYRLGVVKVLIPPLREREGDVELLAMRFLGKYAAENRKKILGFTPGALRGLKNHRWPGNVRELENRIMRAVIMARSSKVTGEDLELSDDNKAARPTLKEARDKTECDLIKRVMRENNFNMAKSAQDLGISRPALYHLVEKYGIRKPE